MSGYAGEIKITVALTLRALGSGLWGKIKETSLSDLLGLPSRGWPCEQCHVCLPSVTDTGLG